MTSNHLSLVSEPDNFWQSLQTATVRTDTSRGQRYPTGLGAIDEIFSDATGRGLKPGIYLLVGDPGSGKSSFALQIMHRLISDGHPGCYLAYEGKNNIFDVMSRIGLSQIIPVVDQDDGWLPDSATISRLLQQGDAANTTGKPAVYCIDSAKNLNQGSLKGRREAIQQLMGAVSSTNSIVFLIGHVSKESRGKDVKKIQGPSELEELIDARIDFVSMEPAKRKRTYLNDLIESELRPYLQDKLAGFANLDAKMKECHDIAKLILAGNAPRKGKIEWRTLHGGAVELVQKLTVKWAAENGGNVRHMGVDTRSKNRLGRPGDWWQFYLTESGWLIPDTAIDTGASEDTVYWRNGVHVSLLDA